MTNTDQKLRPELQIRPEEDRDVHSIREVLVSAFARKQEADLVDKLRRAQAVSVSLVATVEDDLVGHILFSPVRVVSGEEEERAVALGPMTVAKRSGTRPISQRSLLSLERVSINSAPS